MDCYGGGLDTRVNGYPVLLDFRKRVVYSSYTCHIWIQ